MKNNKKSFHSIFFSGIVSLLSALIQPNIWSVQYVTINGSATGRIFDGIGMVNSSGTSKLLKDYPGEQQQDILDFLFKPNFGAGLTIVKNEIGGDINSSSGTEPSHQRLETDSPLPRGVNFWLSKEAKKRNSAVQFAAGRWGIPTWAAASDEKKKNYYLSYLQMMSANGTPLNYLSPEENEGSFNRDYVVNVLKPALNSAGYSSLKLVARDAYQSWGIADTLASDPVLKNIIAVINNHYVTTSTSTAINSSLPLFNDEADTPMLEMWPRLMMVAVNNAKQYVDGKMVRILYQPALDAVYDSIKYNYKGILTANTPWSGYYEVHPSLWMTAHYTQFAKPGWQFLDSACGSVDSNNYYLTLKDPVTNNYSIILVNAGNTSTAYQFTLTGGLSTAALHGWSTNQTEQFVHFTDIVPTNGVFSITIPGQSIYSLTTTDGQQKGTPLHQIPQNTALTLPYTDNFSNYQIGEQPKYTYDQAGAFEVTNLNNNLCLMQTVTTPPNEWGGGTSSRQPCTLFGDSRWVNYQVSADVLLASSGSAFVSGRGALNNRDNNLSSSGYQIQLWNSGNWYFRKVVFGAVTDLGKGTITAFDNTLWHNLKIKMQDNSITAFIDNEQIATVTDTSFSSGQAALGCSAYNNVCFDNLKIEPIDSQITASCIRINDRDSLITYTGTWENEDGTWQDYARSAKKAKNAGALLSFNFNGTAVNVLGRTGTNCGIADFYIDDVKLTTMDCYKSSGSNRVPLFQKSGLAKGNHTLKVFVTGTKNASASDSYIFIDSLEYLGSPFILGDANKDGTVNIIDALVIAQFCVNLPVVIDESAADMNKDGIINIVDALLIAQYTVGLL